MASSSSSTHSQRSTWKAQIPHQDTLPLNSYLVSLLPLEDVFRYVPGMTQRLELDGCEVLRTLACAFLLWHQQQQQPMDPVGRRPSSNTTNELSNNYRNQQQSLSLFILLSMELVPRIYNLLANDWFHLQLDTSRPPGASTPLLANNSDCISMNSLANQRRKRVWTFLRGSWPLIKLALWLQLTQRSNGTDGAVRHTMHSSTSMSTSDNGNLRAHRLPALFVLYAHRRWLHEQAMELRPTLLDPMREALRDTIQFVKELLQTNT